MALTNAQIQAKRQEKLKQAVKELEILEYDCRAATRILEQVLTGLKTVAASDANAKVFEKAMGQIESAMMLISSESRVSRHTTTIV